MSLRLWPDNERSVSPVVSVVLVVAITLVLAATVGALVFNTSDKKTEEPAPTVSAEISQTTNNTETFQNGNMVINVVHESGENIPVSELRITAETLCFDDSSFTTSTKRGELDNLPLDPLAGIQPENVNGKDIFQSGGGATQAPLSGNDETWEAGERLSFEIDSDVCPNPEVGQTGVQVVHKPSNTVISEELYGSEGYRPITPADTSFEFFFPEPRKGSVGYPDDKDILTVKMTDGEPFPPESVYMDVTVEDTDGDTATANGTLDEWTGVDASYGATYKEVPENPNVGTVKKGDRLGNDLTSANSGPGGFGPMDEDNGKSTTIDIKMVFQGKTISQKTLTANDFEVDP